MVGKKKRGHPDLEEILARPWCYYCKLSSRRFLIASILIDLKANATLMI